MTDPHVWPTPARPWVMFQAFQDVLFAHWPVDASVLRAVLPSALPVDTHEGQAWVSIVPFQVRDARPRFFPPIPRLSNIPQVNLRTYVTLDEKPGVFFFSLDLFNPVAVLGARWLFHVAYYHARIHRSRHGDRVNHRSRRQHPGAESAAFEAYYAPVGSVFRAEPGTLDYFLAERYCLYALDNRQRVYRTEIRHQPWPLQSATAEIRVNTLPRAVGLTLPAEAPVLRYARRVDARIWPPERLNR